MCGKFGKLYINLTMATGVIGYVQMLFLLNF